MNRSWSINIFLSTFCFLIINCGQPSAKENPVSNTESAPLTNQEMLKNKALIAERMASLDETPEVDNQAKTPIQPTVAKAVTPVSKPNQTKAIKVGKKKNPANTPMVEAVSPKPVKRPEAEKPIEAIPASSTSITPSPKEPEVIDKSIVKVDHSKWNSLLQKYVSSTGKVNYQGFKADISKLEAYCQELSNNPINTDWSRSEQIAYWINAYNAFTIKLIVDNYPVKSIMDLDGGKPWDRKWIKLGTKTYSLNQIENDILRPQYKDARIHFAVNCAAKSCPPILNKAWTADNLEANFNKQTKSFINNPSYNQISESGAKVSKIFDWYGEDFGDLKAFLSKYSGFPVKGDIEFLDYDWGLNE